MSMRDHKPKLSFLSTILKATQLSLLLIVSLLMASPTSHAKPSTDIVSELLSLQSRSESGVIQLDDDAVRRFLSAVPTPRPYSFLIFFDAVHLHDSNPDLHLPSLFSEFSVVSKSFLSHHLHTPTRSKLFFARLEFKQSQPSFALFGVNSLPHIRLVSPDASDLRLSLPMDQSHLSRLADSMAEFVESRTGLPVGPILRPPLLSTPVLVSLLLLSLSLLPFAIKKFVAGDTFLHDRRIWLSGAVFVYFFSVSGAMHNIIRKMPMFLTDRNDPSRLVFFYQGSGMQLGAEGFAVGFLYTIVGLLLGFVTHVLVRVRSVGVQRAFMFLAILVSFWAVKKVIYLDSWKTGYGIHGFWPSGWN